MMVTKPVWALALVFPSSSLPLGLALKPGSGAVLPLCSDQDGEIEHDFGAHPASLACDIYQACLVYSLSLATQQSVER